VLAPPVGDNIIQGLHERREAEQGGITALRQVSYLLLLLRLHRSCPIFVRLLILDRKYNGASGRPEQLS